MEGGRLQFHSVCAILWILTGTEQKLFSDDEDNCDNDDNNDKYGKDNHKQSDKNISRNSIFFVLITLSAHFYKLGALQ